MSAKKNNTGLILLLLGGGGFVYWRFFYIGAGDKAAARNYLTNRGVANPTDADIMNVLKTVGKDKVAANQVPNNTMQIVTPGNISNAPIYQTPGFINIPGTISVNPGIFSTPASGIDITSLTDYTDNPMDNLDFDFSV